MLRDARVVETSPVSDKAARWNEVQKARAPTSVAIAPAIMPVGPASTKRFMIFSQSAFANAAKTTSSSIFQSFLKSFA